MKRNLPQVIPYQGSKRKIAPVVMKYVPKGVHTFYEPFAGSAAVTINAAAIGKAKSYVMSDILDPLMGIWGQVITQPEKLSDLYEEIWTKQHGNERKYFDQIRDEFNEDRDPVKLLFLIARCVKNAVRFNSSGAFNQSPDNRRTGMNPNTMRSRILSVSNILKGKTRAVCADFEESLKDVTSCDFVYMDPPYQGTSNKKDTRYAEQLDLERLIALMERLNSKDVPFVLSFDGFLGGKSYCKGLPANLGLKRLYLDTGRSSQATLLGRTDRTVESLYLSPALTQRVEVNLGSDEEINLDSWSAFGKQQVLPI